MNHKAYTAIRPALIKWVGEGYATAREAGIKDADESISAYWKNQPESFGELSDARVLSFVLSLTKLETVQNDEALKYAIETLADEIRAVTGIPY